jgi:Zn-dependent M28 family amino/carboxypeptidase
LSNLKDHCEFLANPALNGRVPGREGNRLARNYIRQKFEEIGLTPLFGQSWYQEYPTQASGKLVIGKNVGGTLEASVGNINAPTMIIGAHYDHLEGIPGADDNASSIAIWILLCQK